jgi:ComF family protein
LRPPAFSRAIVPLRYEGLVTRWIHALKNQLGMVEGRVLGGLLADAAAELRDGAGAPELLVPVPLRWSRLALRGHNQALTLGRHVARALDLPINPHAARRTGRAPSQRGLGRDARRRNLAGVFTASPVVAGRRVAIVDDVMTTGSTAEALANELLGAGAQEVWVLAVARATLPQAGAHGIPTP